MSGEFASLARELSENELWDKYHLFTTKDVRRMKDVEFCASLILLYRKGIIDQTDQSALNQAYEELQSGYTEAESDKKVILNAIELIPSFFISDEVAKFLKKKTQLYTLFSVIFYMLRTGLEINETLLNDFSRFVGLYSLFNNEMDLTDKMNDSEKTLYDWLKKYKLASSEGLNKHTNRMIRYNVLKDFLFSITDDLSIAAKTLREKMLSNPVDPSEDSEELD